MKKLSVSGGTQHAVIPSQTVEAYETIYTQVKQACANEELSRFFPMQGKRYNEYMQLPQSVFADSNPKTEQELEQRMEPAVRLMLVGRCVNGWATLEEESPQAFSKAAVDSILREGFIWLNDDGTAVSTYIRQDGVECRYNINKSKFWRCCRKILAQLKPETAVGSRWFEHIVWTNLFPVAPPNGGNATGKLQKVQLTASKELLQQQIAFYAPTHILFLTDWDGWFDSFADLFAEVKRVGDSAVDMVVGKGYIGTAKAVVTIRPDRTRPTNPRDDEFAVNVVNVFKDL